MRNPLIQLPAGLLASAVWLPVARADAEAGKKFFNAIEGGNCKSCHYTSSLRQWLSDPQGTGQADHPETQELKERTRKVRVRATSCVKKPMTDAEAVDLVDFLETLEKEGTPCRAERRPIRERQLDPENIHVAHRIIDAGVDTAWVREMIGGRLGADAELPPDCLVDPASIGNAHWFIHQQPRDAWTFDLDPRPAVEKW